MNSELAKVALRLDVEMECDGLISYDRIVPIVGAEKVAEAIRASMPTLSPK